MVCESWKGRCGALSFFSAARAVADDILRGGRKHPITRRCVAPSSRGTIVSPGSSPLLTDLYQLNMIEAYLAYGETEPAVFEFFFRR
jgi:hypothetical protein